MPRPFAKITGLRRPGGRPPVNRGGHRRARLLRAALALVLTASLLVVTSPRIDAAPPAWATVSSPNGTSGIGEILAVAKVSSTEAWAVGYGSSTWTPLIEHYSSGAWTTAVAPAVTGGSKLTAVAVVSATDVWAVGFSQPAGINQTLTLHYNGTTWSVVPSPDVGAQDNQFYGVAAITSTNVWAVGYASPSGNNQTLTENYTSAAGTATATTVTSLTQASATWAVNAQVGRTIAAGASTGVVTSNTATVLTVASWAGGTPAGTSTYTLIGWAVVTSPDTATTEVDQLLGVSAVSATDIWAVGNGSVTGTTQNLTEHYTTMSSTATANSTTSLTDGTQAWAVNAQVGRTVLIPSTGKSAVVTSNTATVLTFAAWSPTGAPGNVAYTLAGWAMVSSPNTASNLYTTLSSVNVVSAADAWAVGEVQIPTAVFQTLTEHYTTMSSTATANSTTSLTDGTQAWAVNSQVGRTVLIPSTGKSAVVTSNTATVLTFAAWSPTGAPGNVAYVLSGWAIVGSPNTLTTQNNGLAGASVISATDVWAVGYGDVSSVDQTLTEHYTSVAGTATATSATSLTDGTQAWAVNSQVGRTITAGSTTGVVTSNTATVLTITAWSPVGTPGGTTAYTLSGWAIVTSPDISTTQGHQLLGVVAISATELWAVGYGNVTANPYVMTQHFTSAGGTATATSATTLTDGTQSWAVNSQVGRTITAGSTTGVVASNTATVLTIAAWSPAVTPGGTTAYTLWGWAVVASGPGNVQGSELLGTAMVNASELWAVGYFTDGMGNSQTLAEHYISGAWSVVSTPIFQYGATLDGVTVVSSSDIWAVGYLLNVSSQSQTLTLHYDGTTWSTITSPDTATNLNNVLSAVTAVSTSNVWAVGYAANGSSFNQPLTEQYTTAAGTATATSATTLTQAGQTWAVNSQMGRTIAAGVSTGVVTSNTATVLTVASWTGGTPAATSAYTLIGWAIVTSPSPSAAQHALFNGVVDTTSGDLWAVGSHNVTGTAQNMIDHWTTAAGTSSATTATSLTDPSGSWGTNSEVGRTVGVGSITGVVTSNTGTVLTIAAWSPVSTPAAVSTYTLSGWATVSSPNTLVSQNNAMQGVTAVSPTDIWAVGYGSVAGVVQTMTLHDTTMSSLATSAPTATTLTDTTQSWPVNSQAGRTVWIPSTGESAVVTSNTATVLTFAAWSPVVLPGAVPYTLSGWAVVTSPNTATNQANPLQSVTAISASELWAVGHGNVAAIPQTLTEHYTTLSSTATSNSTTSLTDTGQNWAVNAQVGRTVTIPSTGKAAVVTSNTATVLTFAAWSPAGAPGNVPYTLSGWAIVASTNLGSSVTNSLMGVVASSSTNVWAVGYGLPSGVAATLVEQYSGTVTATTTTLSSNLNPGNYGTAAFFTATVTPASPVPTGNVTFMDGTTVLNTIPLDGSGNALFGTPALSVAGSPHSITAVYSGDAVYASSTSSAVSQVINAALNGPLYSWGKNDLGELGTGATTNYSACPAACSDVPQQPTGVGTSIVAGAAGYASAAVTAGGNVYTWGTNGDGELGTGVSSCGVDPCLGSATPSLVLAGACTVCGTNLNNVIQITNGTFTMMVLRNDGTVWTWGYGGNGELGINSTANSTTPVQVRDNSGVGVLTGIVQIAEEGHTQYALRYDGTVWSWGCGSQGVRGDNSTATVGALPVRVRNSGNSGVLTGIVSVGASNSAGYAVTSAGAALAWGEGDIGQLGNGTTGLANALPVAVTGLGSGTTVSVTGSAATAYALLANGTVDAWGDGSFGQLGNNTPAAERSAAVSGVPRRSRSIP